MKRTFCPKKKNRNTSNTNKFRYEPNPVKKHAERKREKLDAFLRYNSISVQENMVS